MDPKSAHHLLATPTYKGKAKVRQIYRIPLPAPGPRFASFADTVGNTVCALLERVFYHEIGGVFTVPVNPSGTVVRLNLDPFRNCLKYFATPLTPVAYSDFPNFYSGQRRKMFVAAALAVQRTGPLKKHSYLSTFLKHEKIPVLAKRAVPRVIQPRDVKYNVALGRYLRPLEHILYKDIARVFGRPTVMKGLNASAIGKLFANEWGRYTRPRALGLDASRFDQHISRSLLQWEHQVYELYYPGREELRRLLAWQCSTKGFVRCPGYRVKYATIGGRCSGDMNTAMGNCLVMCAALYSLLTRLNMTGKLGTKVSVFNNGDDCTLIGEREDIATVEAMVPTFFGELGLIMKVEPVVDTLEEVVFCQMQPVFDGVDWRMCRDPRVCISKDLYVLDPLCATKHLSTQLYAIGECGMSLAGGLPVLQEFYAALLRNGSRGTAVDKNFLKSGFRQLAYGMHQRYRLVSDASRVSFYRAFKIVPDLQMAMEQLYATAVCDLSSPDRNQPREMPI